MDDFGFDTFDDQVHPLSNPIDWPTPVEEKKKVRPQLKEDTHEVSKKDEGDDDDDDIMGLIACL
jgi:hypothetical protein